MIQILKLCYSLEELFEFLFIWKLEKNVSCFFNNENKTINFNDMVFHSKLKCLSDVEFNVYDIVGTLEGH